MAVPNAVSELDTPCVLLDRPRVQRNIDRMTARADSLGVALRPHMKTCKSIDVARMFCSGRPPSGITVSTLREAEYFFDHGIGDILYAVGIVPAKLQRVAKLNARGAQIRLTLDSLEAARSVTEFARARETDFEVVIEIDTDGHRAGLAPDDPQLPPIADLLADSDHVHLTGVMTHAGDSYGCDSPTAIASHAEQERALCVRAADVLRERSIECPVVSVGSTPTVTFAASLEGVTEIRPGNFVFYDLFQVGLGVCTQDDIGVSVLCSVIGHDRRANRMFTDAGGLALSKDRGTGSQRIDQRYGIVRGAEALVVADVNQEHGVITTRDGRAPDFERYPIGAKLEILPVHSCMTAAAHDRYYVVDETELVDVWSRCNGW